MMADKRLALLAGLSGAVLALSACPPPAETGSDAGTDAGDNTACIDDSDCPDSQLFFCNTTTSTCQPSCRSKTDCTAASRGEYALAYCDSNALGCQCDEGTCVAALCSSDAECGSGMACRNGACATAPAAASVASCQITPDFSVLRAGEKATFWVSLWDGANKPVVLAGSDIAWTAATGRVTGADATGTSAEFTGGTAGAAEAAVKVTAGSATCTAQVVVIDSTVTAGKVRAIVTNELTGRPIAGATVIASGPTDGLVIGTPATTDASGAALVDLPAGASKNVTVSVFHNDFGYLTVANYNGSTGSRDLHFALRRNQVDMYGGYKGTFTDVPQTPNVQAGLAAMSIPGSVTDLSVSQLLGATVPTDIVIGSAINQQDVPVPAGAFLGFTGTPIKSDISAQGLAGVCNSSLAGVTDVEAAINEGRCGTRTAWALAGDIPLGDLPIDAFAGGLNNINFGAVLSRIIPIFKKFNSSIVRDVQFTLKATPGAVDGAHDFSDVSTFSDANHDFDSVPLGFAFAAKVPALPKFKGTYADGLIVLGGADVKGRGLVPLGLGAGVNTQEPKDATVDLQAGLPSAGLVLTRMAPTHSGIEGSPYLLSAIALSLTSVNDASAGLAMSALVSRIAENKLAFDAKGATPTEIAGTFMNYPENAKYNFTDAAQPGIGARTFKFINGQDLSAASIIRFQFTDLQEHRWQVISDVATANAGVVLPKPPGSFADRTYHTGSTTGSRSTLMVQAIQLKNGTTPLTFANLVEFNSTNADRMGDFMTAFSVVDYSRPSVSWTEPAEGATIPPSSTLKLKVSSFKVGTTATDDGIVRITFVGAAGCTPVDIANDASGGKGELTATLPSTCAGANVEMTATLFNTTGTMPILPGVSSKRTVNIQ